MRIIVGIATIIATMICFSQTSYGTHQNPTQYINFTTNNEQNTTIDHGKTDIAPLCHEMDHEQYLNTTTISFDFTCTSPVLDVTCAPVNQTHCVCNSGANKAHTVKVTMLSGCKDPN